MGKPKVAICACVHDDHWFFEASLRSLQGVAPGFAFVSRVAWNGSAGNWQSCADIARPQGFEVMVGDWPDETTHRRHALQTLREKGFDYAITPDSDEVLEPALVQALLAIAAGDLADRVYVTMDTYWKSPEYVVRPRERITPLMMLSLHRAGHVHIRDYAGGRHLVLGPEYGAMHHLSYGGPDERIERKLATWSHKDEVVEGWLERVWRGWDADHLMRNLHPTHPPAYGFAERIRPPEVLSGIPLTFGSTEQRKEITAGSRWPKVSIVIPLCGNPEDIRLCLDSLARLQDLMGEVIVVDNGSTDGADKVAEGFDFVKLIRNKENLGFARASNQGMAGSTGDVVLFLNSDTILPRAGLFRLIGSLMSSNAIGAAGPYTNECGHSQRLDPTYTSLENLDLFAEDFAARDAPDEDAPADMLVGFCLAVRRSVLDEIGNFDEAYGIGSFEDNDLCYRIRRAGYRLVISSRAYVHHFGSRTLGRVSSNPWKLLADNERRFREKWRDDLETGFASHLPGLVNNQIVFDNNRSPEKRLAAARRRAKQADISLCMIVRNEERVLGSCLKSAAPFFSQIVAVDTGSTDNTIQIAKDYGAEVHQMKWPDSFAAARNHSLKFARGKWIFWLDADDTLPWACGEEIQKVALNCPKEVVGFVVPVQFVEDGPGAGTRVDHVKLFRNLPGVCFEGRIHEQNLASLREKGGLIARCQAVVLHSGYDTSLEGQRRKREREEKLLRLDLKERPDHPFVLFNLGMTAHYTELHEEAISWMKKSIEKAGPGESHLRKAYALMAMSQRRLGRTGEALSTILRGLTEVGEDPELHFQAGITLAEMGRFDEAIRHYLLVEDNLEGHFSSIDIGILGPKRCHNLAALYMQTGEYPKAREWWLRSLDGPAPFLPGASELFRAALSVGDHATARQMVDRVQQLTGKGDDWAQMAAAYADATLGPEAGEWFLRREIDGSPRVAGPRLVLVRRLLAEGREEEAMPHLDALVRQGVAEAAYYLGVSANRRGDYPAALAWMERAHDWNPDHQPTRDQIANLKKLLGGAEELA